MSGAPDTGPDLAGLADLADDIDAGRPASAPRPAADPAAVARAEAAELVELVAALLLPVLPVLWPAGGDRIVAAYGTEQQARIAAALGAVAVKRAWSLSDTFGRYGPEIALAAALAGPALPVLLEVARARRKPAGGALSPVAEPAAIDLAEVPPQAREYSTADDGRVK